MNLLGLGALAAFCQRRRCGHYVELHAPASDGWRAACRIEGCECLRFDTRQPAHGADAGPVQYVPRPRGEEEAE